MKEQKNLTVMEILFNLKESSIKNFGIVHIQNFLENQLHLYELQIAANRLTKALQETPNVNWEDEFEQARQKAWDEYDSIFLNKE